MKEKLIEVWKSCETKQLASIFEDYMKSIGVRKYNSRRRDNTNTYMIDGKSTDWNRVQCYYHKASERYSEEDLLIVLRKRSGDYFIIGREGARAFEVDYNGVVHYEENLLKQIIEDHKPLFDALFGSIATRTMEYDKLPSRGKKTSDGEETRKCACGGRCYVFYDENSQYHVECENCSTVVSYKASSMDRAIKLWNDMPTALGA